MKKYFGMIVSFVIYLLAGIFMGMHIDALMEFQGPIVGMVIVYIAFIGGIFFHLAIHEGGHLLFGLMSGYKFQSYRVGSHIWVKQNGKIVHKRYNLAGTGGQCILSLGNSRSFFLYNIGGVAINCIVSLCLIGISTLIHNGVITDILFIIAISGFAIALTNGIPLTMGEVDNDGMNIYHLAKRQSSREAFFNQLLIQEKINDGIRIKDMDDQYLTYDVTALNDPLVAAIKVSQYQKYLDQHDLEKAESIIQELKQPEVNLLGIHRLLMENDENLLHYLKGEPFSVSKPLEKFNKQMKNYPGVIRSNYIYALHDGKDPTAYEKQLQDLKDTYPYISEIETELELIQMVKEKGIE